MNDLERLYGNGAAYVSDGEGIYEFPSHNFDIVSVNNCTGIEYWMTRGAVATFGSDTDRAQAVLALKRIIKKIANTPKKKFNPQSKV